MGQKDAMGGLFGGGLFGDPALPDVQDAREQELIAVYERLGRTLDDLAYTAEFDRLRAILELEEPPGDTLRRLQRLRKGGRLPRLGRPSGLPIRIPTEEQHLVEQLALEHIPSLGQRDQLPYTPAFDAIVERFNASTGRSLDHHAIWRMLARLAK